MLGLLCINGDGVVIPCSSDIVVPSDFAYETHPVTSPRLAAITPRASRGHGALQWYETIAHTSRMVEDTLAGDVNSPVGFWRYL